jgi:PAS domain S-box-containing protein
MIKVLIIEDEQMIAEDIRFTLTQYNYEVAGIFSKGEDAVENLDDIRPDIILMDIMLEGELNGIETGIKVKEKFDIPIIFLTAYADISTIESTKQIAPYGYILKPFEAKELYAAIEIALVKYNSEKKLEESKAKFESMFLGNPEPCAYLDNDFTIVNVNPRFIEFFGYTLEEIKGKKINSVIIPDDKNNEAIKLNDDTLSGYVYFDSFRKDKAGELLPVSISAAPIFINNEVKGSFVIYKDITERKRIEEERENLISKLRKALDEVKTLEGLIPICSHCKKIRDDSGFWGNVEHYIAKHSNVDFSHGICPDCLEKHYPEQFKKIIAKENI